MPALALKPTAGARIRPSSPFAENLVIAMPMVEGGGYPRNLVDGIFGVPNTVGSVPFVWKPTIYGQGYNSPSLAGNRILKVSHNTPVTVAALTVEVWVSFAAFQTSTPFISALCSIGTGSGFMRAGDSTLADNQLEMQFGASKINGSANLVTGQLYCFHGVSGAGGSLTNAPVKLYQNGIQIASGTSTLNTTAITQSFLFADSNSSGRTPNATIYAFHVWAKSFTAAKVQQRYADPWSLYDNFTDSAIRDYFFFASTVAHPPFFLLSPMKTGDF
jgi:hypothetical protein